MAVLVVVTVLAALAAPHARTVRGVVAGELAELPTIGLPGPAPAAGDDARAARAVAFALAQRGKPYRWGAARPAGLRLLGVDLGGLASGRGERSPGPRPASSPASPASGGGSSRAT